MHQSRGARVEVRNIYKSFGSVEAVTDVSLRVRAGEFVSLLGPSGSGKTTTLMSIAGFERPDEGSILIDDVVVDAVPAQKRDIGFVFQNYALFPHLSVAANVAYPLEIRGMPKESIRKKVRDALEMVDLSGEDFGKRRPGLLSGGQQQRVALARALVFDPRVLLMDEPLGALDRRLREVMLDELRHLHRNLGATIIYVTHDQGEALSMSDRIAVFDSGRIQQIGTPSQLYDKPTSEFVAKFLGDSNIVPVIRNGSTEQPWQSLNGASLLGRPAVDRKPSHEYSLLIRPERLRLASPEDGLTAGAVADVVYVGDHIRVVISTPICEFTATVFGNTGALRPVVGDRVGVSWDEKDGVPVVRDARGEGSMLERSHRADPRA